MSQTIREISESLGVNRNKIYRIVDKLELTPEVVDGVKRYQESYLKAIKAELKKTEKRPQDAATASRTADNPTTGNQDVIDALKDVIRVQSETIDDLRARNQELTEMLKHEQEIRLGQLALEANHKPNALKRITGRLFHRGGNNQEQ